MQNIFQQFFKLLAEF